MPVNDKGVYISIYKKMLLIRKFEEKLFELFSEGIMHGTCHLCIGEEAAPSAAADACRKGDYAMGTHRGHGHALAWGVDPKFLMAEFFGRTTGICKGMGGSMHITDIDNFFLGTNGIVAAGIPIATGAALSIKRKNIKDKIAVCFFGDGATNEGAFYESLNMAMLWKLPVLYICENNKYSMSTHISRNMSEPDIEKKAGTSGIKAITVDGNDAVKIYDEVRAARKYVLETGPMLIIADTYRISGHSKNDENVYRSAGEIELWKKRCPIKRMEKYLLDNGLATKKETANIKAEIDMIIKGAVEFSVNSPLPKMEEVKNYLYI